MFGLRWPGVGVAGSRPHSNEDPPRTRNWQRLIQLWVKHPLAGVERKFREEGYRLKCHSHHPIIVQSYETFRHEQAGYLETDVQKIHHHTTNLTATGQEHVPQFPLNDWLIDVHFLDHEKRLVHREIGRVYYSNTKQRYRTFSE
ncbi:hypothetical protein AVEN_31298-1 [Araneus ventricosus]|uniref:Uncharacterized protein n=1 Tax=Araneus ventricosus TaxID=182803 RepID=A0A4Y2G9Y6_ARAVE|nr:hypothetical protein AVEN_31298-1 [Araneus ventricosus]